jgi:hypothetical protein
VRNFRNTKHTPPNPILCCLKKTGPGDIILMISDIIIIKGESVISPITAPTTSIERFQTGILLVKNGFREGMDLIYILFKPSLEGKGIFEK